MPPPGPSGQVPSWPVVCLLTLALTCTSSVAAGGQAASGADIRAAFLLNFSKFVEWPAPAAPSPDFVIGVLGDDAVAEALQVIVAGKSTGGRPLVARRVVVKDDLGDLQMIYVGTSEGSRLAEVLRRTTTGSVLTVSDLDRFCQQGGMIQFRSERDRVRFDVNLGQAERSRLVMNSKLLALAKTVHSARPPGGSR